jgi:uncharacterized protein YukE
MGRVREEHGHIQSVLGTLNSKISAVLAKQEGDFLAAYRAHMYTVQKELQSLRYVVAVAAVALAAAAARPACCAGIVCRGLWFAATCLYEGLLTLHCHGA